MGNVYYDKQNVNGTNLKSFFFFSKQEFTMKALTYICILYGKVERFFSGEETGCQGVHLDPPHDVPIFD